MLPQVAMLVDPLAACTNQKNANVDIHLSTTSFVCRKRTCADSLDALEGRSKLGEDQDMHYW